MKLTLTKGGKAKYQKAKTDYELSEEDLLKRENIKISPKGKAIRGKAKSLSYPYLAELLGNGWYKEKVERFFRGDISITEPEAKKVCETLNIDFNIQDFKETQSKPSIQNTNFPGDKPLQRELLTIHPELVSTTHCAEKTNIIKPVAIDDWIEDVKEEVINNLKDNRKYSELSRYVSLKVKFNYNNEILLSSHYLENIATNQTSQLIMIRAEVGYGKSTIAFQIARWALEKKLSEFTILPILLEPLSDTDTVTEQIRKFFINVTSYTEEILTEAFVNRLVTQKRLLIILDQFSELTDVQKQRLQDKLPNKAFFLITSRKDESNRFRFYTINTIQPQLLSKDDLAYFIEDFLVNKKSQYQIEEIEFVFSKIVGNLAISPLLATKALEAILEYFNDFNKFRSNQAFCVSNDSLPTINLKKLLEEYIMYICKNSNQDVHSLYNEVQALLSVCSSSLIQVKVSVVQDFECNKGLCLYIYQYWFSVTIFKINQNSREGLDPLLPLLYSLWLVYDKTRDSSYFVKNKENITNFFYLDISSLIYFASLTRYNDSKDSISRAKWLDIAGRFAIGNEMSPDILIVLSKIVDVSEGTTNYFMYIDILKLIGGLIRENNHQICHSLSTIFARFIIKLIDRLPKDNHYVEISTKAIQTLGIIGSDTAVDKLLEIVGQDSFSYELRIEALKSFEFIDNVDLTFSRLDNFFILLIQKKNVFSLNEIRSASSACTFIILTALSKTLQRIGYLKSPEWGQIEGFRVPMVCLKNHYDNDSCKISLERIEPEVWHLPLPSEQKIEVVCINPGLYTLGSPKQEAYRDGVYLTKSVGHSDHIERVRKIEINKFLISRNPVTQAQFKSLVKGLRFPAKESPFNDDRFPIVNLSSKEAIEWCQLFTNYLRNKHILQMSESVSLPTSDQWEVACRAGSSHMYHFGRDLLPEYSNFNPDNHSNMNRLENHKLQPSESNYFGVSNKWGISDMHGNVFEWCLHPKSEITAIARGGSFRTASAYCRSAYQYIVERIDYTMDDIGFRICVEIL